MHLFLNIYILLCLLNASYVKIIILGTEGITDYPVKNISIVAVSSTVFVCLLQHYKLLHIQNMMPHLFF